LILKLIFHLILIQNTGSICWISNIVEKINDEYLTKTKTWITNVDKNIYAVVRGPSAGVRRDECGEHDESKERDTSHGESTADGVRQRHPGGQQLHL
jgi:hypothetical protein